MSNRLQAMFDKLPPHSIESEMVYLGCCITDLYQFDRTAHIIESPDAFYYEPHQGIFRVLAKISENTTSTDLTYIDQQCRKAGIDYGGSDYLLNLAQSAAHLALAETHAKTIRRHWKTRRLIDAMGKAVYDAYRDDDEPDQIIDRLTDQLTAIASLSDGGQILDAREIAASIARKIKVGVEEKVVCTGFPTLDKWLRGGVRGGEVMVVGGRPGQGKTALAVNMLTNAAKAGHKVAFVTIEMSPEGIVRRMLGPSINIENRDGAYRNAIASAKKFSDCEIPIVNLSSGSLGEMRRHIRSLVRTKGIDGVFVDYLQLVQTEQASKEYERISVVSTSIKRMAREFNLAVWNLAQINRDGGKKERPTMADLKGSGSIEQDADQVVLIHNPVAFGDHEDPPELIVAKHRNGRTGSIVVDYRPSETRFEEVQPEQQQEIPQ